MTPARCSMRQIAGALLAAAAVAAAWPASAQSPRIYRCGNEYSPIPCRDGKVVETQDAASPADVAQARSAASRERRLADQMERDRLRAEARPRPAPASVGPGKPAASANLKPPRKAKGKIRVVAGDDFVAAPPPKGKPAAKAASASR